MLIAACDAVPTPSSRTDQIDELDRDPDPLLNAASKVLVLWVTDGAGTDNGRNGAIPGGMTLDSPTEIGAVVLADRLTRCGSTRYVVDLSSNHVGYVFVPSTANDLQLVKCVQKLTDFSFSAGIGTPANITSADPEQFKALHA